MKDSRIIELFFARDQQALTESQTKFGSYYTAVARNILSDSRDVEEALNQTWFEAWKIIPPNKPDVLSAFLGKITRNISLNMIRSRSAQKRQADFAESYSELEEMIGSRSVEDEISAKELSESINRFIGDLPEKQQKIFVCRYWYFDSVEEIGKRFGFSKSKVKSTLYRIRKKLHKHLQEEELL